MRGLSDEAIWKKLDEMLSSSTCLKTQTAAAIIKDNEVLSVGCNFCAPEGYDYREKFSCCPRMAIKTGKNYELCKPIHAEVVAALGIRKDRNYSELGKYASHLSLSESDIRAAFSEEELNKLSGATLYLIGHYRACEGCVKFLDTVGIKTIKLNEKSSETIKSRYTDLKIT